MRTFSKQGSPRPFRLIVELCLCGALCAPAFLWAQTQGPEATPKGAPPPTAVPPTGVTPPPLAGQPLPPLPGQAAGAPPQADKNVAPVQVAPTLAAVPASPAAPAVPEHGAAANAAPEPPHAEMPKAASAEAGAEVHAPAAHGQEAAAHGGGHNEGPVIQNWFSWDYGPGRPNHHPPFGFALINFAVFLFILWRLAGKSMVEFLHSRHHNVSKALDEAADLKREAEATLARFQERIGRIDADVAEMVATVRKEAEAEKARIVAAANAQADQMRADAEARIESEIAKARADLRAEVVKQATAAAEALIKGHMGESDQKRMLDDYISRLEALPQAARQQKPSIPGMGPGTPPGRLS